MLFITKDGYDKRQLLSFDAILKIILFILCILFISQNIRYSAMTTSMSFPY